MSTKEKILNLRIQCEKYFLHRQNRYDVFNDFKAASDRVWHSALWAMMQKNSININIKSTVELQWLEHFWDHENQFETGVVRANEC